ncbi:PAS domain S-box protein [Breoghania sp.]|uniref:PAS domain S-box protein n=1 Tax=Breoghania sp. TaxID=2065378 RepID=UPI00261AC30D|nr:PAS domain S-box protein [Breoghania sp.]MDJ0929559.1 PAS domain S-box protein [Breoghania sp.]
MCELLARGEPEGLLEIGDTVAYYLRDPGHYSQQSAQIGFALQIPVAILFGDADAIKKHVIYICIITTLLFSIIAIFFAKSFIRPLGFLTKQISGSTNAELLKKLPIERDDKIGDLARSFRDRTQALMDSEEYANTIVNNVPDGLILLDGVGIVEELNPNCERMFGYQADEIVGKHVERLLSDGTSQYDETFSEIFEKLQDHSQPLQARELEAVTAKGDRFPIEIGISTLKVKGMTKFSGIIRDISERRKIERIRTEFVATVSHELRTPPTSIRGDRPASSETARGEGRTNAADGAEEHRAADPARQRHPRFRDAAGKQGKFPADPLRSEPRGGEGGGDEHHLCAGSQGQAEGHHLQRTAHCHRRPGSAAKGSR